MLKFGVSVRFWSGLESQIETPRVRNAGYEKVSVRNVWKPKSIMQQEKWCPFASVPSDAIGAFALTLIHPLLRSATRQSSDRNAAYICADTRN